MVFIKLLIVITVIVFFLVLLPLFLGYYITHISMNLSTNLDYDFVHFKTFINEYKKYENSPELKHEWGGKSIFLKEYKDGDYKYILYLHADIVEINGKCMIFYPISWIKYCLWMKQFKEGKRIKGLWKVNNI